MNYYKRRNILLYFSIFLFQILLFGNLDISVLHISGIIIGNILIWSFFNFSILENNYLMLWGLTIFDINFIFYYLFFIYEPFVNGYSTTDKVLIGLGAIGIQYISAKIFLKKERKFVERENEILDAEVNQIIYFSERREEIKRIQSYLDSHDTFLIGIEGVWGSGKTSLMKKIQIDNKDKIFINVDLLAINVDDVIQYLINELNKCLLYEGIVTFNALLLQQHFNKNIYIEFLLKFILGERAEYAILFRRFKESLKQCKKSIIIVYDDVERISNIDTLKKIFYISEKLSGYNIKVIYQYDMRQLKRLGFSQLYLNKYIPVSVRLSDIPFNKMLKYILKNYNSDNKLSFVKENQDKFNLFLVSRLQFNRLENNRGKLFDYQKQFMNIRAIIQFLNELEFMAAEFKEELSRNSLLINVLIATSYIKTFCPDFYYSIDISKPLLENFFIRKDKDNILIYDLLSDNDKMSINNLISCHNIDNNELNLQSIIAFYVLNLDYFIELNNDKQLDNEESVFEYNIDNNSSYEERKKEYYLVNYLSDVQDKISLVNLQSQFYSIICAGVEGRSEYLYTADKIKDILMENDANWQYKVNNLMNRFYQGIERTNTIVFMGYSEWIAIFKAINIASFRWTSQEQEIVYKNIFSMFMKNECKGYLRKSFVEDILYFMEGIRKNQLKSCAIKFMQDIVLLKIDQNLEDNIFFIEFQGLFYKMILRLGYIDSSFYREKEIDIIFNCKDLSKYVIKEEVEKFFLNDLSYSKKLIERSPYKDVLKNKVAEIELIINFINKIKKANKYDKEDYVEPNNKNFEWYSTNNRSISKDMSEDEFMSKVDAESLSLIEIKKFIKKS